jgi:hypothetical protein
VWLWFRQGWLIKGATGHFPLGLTRQLILLAHNEMLSPQSIHLLMNYIPFPACFLRDKYQTSLHLKHTPQNKLLAAFYD